MEKDPSKALWLSALGVVGLVCAGYELSTGKALVTDRSSGRDPFTPSTFTVTRTERPMLFWAEVIASGGGGLYFLYRALQSRRE
jgi:hypothetical protein